MRAIVMSYPSGRRIAMPKQGMRQSLQRLPRLVSTELGRNGEASTRWLELTRLWSLFPPGVARPTCIHQESSALSCMRFLVVLDTRNRKFYIMRSMQASVPPRPSVRGVTHDQSGLTRSGRHLGSPLPPIAWILADGFRLAFPPQVGSRAVHDDHQQVMPAGVSEPGPLPREINQESCDETPN